MAKQTIEEKWRQQSEAAQQEAEKLPFGKKRGALVRRAQQLKDRLPNQSMAVIACVRPVPTSALSGWRYLGGKRASSRPTLVGCMILYGLRVISLQLDEPIDESKLIRS